MALIRARQRALTAVSPHQGNRTHIVPKRRWQELSNIRVTGGTDNGDGSYTLTGPGDELVIRSQVSQFDGRFRVSYDVIAAVGPEGDCTDPPGEGWQPATNETITGNGDGSDTHSYIIATGQGGYVWPEMRVRLSGAAESMTINNIRMWKL